MSAITITQVDAFTDEAYRGNPAAVCALEGPKSAAWMQAVANEMNLSETAFSWPEGEAYRLRWFTPAQEVDLCGHATLACAHALWERGDQPAEAAIAFLTRSGPLTARRESDGIALELPADPPRRSDEAERFAAALGLEVVYAGGGKAFKLAEVADAAALRALEPDTGAIAALAWGLIVTARAEPGSGYDFISRVFAPGAGIAEDPVTGAAHCQLACYWSAKLGRDELRAYQASARGGSLTVTARGDRVELRGRAVTVMRGALAVEPREAP